MQAASPDGLEVWRVTRKSIHDKVGCSIHPQGSWLNFFLTLFMYYISSLLCCSVVGLGYVEVCRQVPACVTVGEEFSLQPDYDTWKLSTNNISQIQVTSPSTFHILIMAGQGADLPMWYLPLQMSWSDTPMQSRNPKECSRFSLPYRLTWKRRSFSLKVPWNLASKSCQYILLLVLTYLIGRKTGYGN